jgi:hypothetical protein
MRQLTDFHAIFVPFIGWQRHCCKAQKQAFTRVQRDANGMDAGLRQMGLPAL